MRDLLMVLAILAGMTLPSWGQQTKKNEPSNRERHFKQITNRVGMKLVLIPAGKFVMGSPFDGQEFGRGNVWEWCHDRFGEYPATAVIDPQGPREGLHPVVRGGCWYSSEECRSAYRFAGGRGLLCDPLGDRLGLRVAMTPGEMEAVPKK